MNKINNAAGFEMSATIEAKTKGIWIWCVPHPKVKGRCLALMDTEGLGDPMKVINTLITIIKDCRCQSRGSCSASVC